MGVVRIRTLPSLFFFPVDKKSTQLWFSLNWKWLYYVSVNFLMPYFIKKNIVVFRTRPRPEIGPVIHNMGYIHNWPTCKAIKEGVWHMCYASTRHNTLRHIQSQLKLTLVTCNIKYFPLVRTDRTHWTYSPFILTRFKYWCEHWSVCRWLHHPLSHLPLPQIVDCIYNGTLQPMHSAMIVQTWTSSIIF